MELLIFLSQNLISLKKLLSKRLHEHLWNPLPPPCEQTWTFWWLPPSPNPVHVVCERPRRQKGQISLMGRSRICKKNFTKVYLPLFVKKIHEILTDQKSKEEFQLAKTIFIQAQKCKGVQNSNEHSTPQWNSFIWQNVECNGSSYNFLHVWANNGYFNH